MGSKSLQKDQEGKVTELELRVSNLEQEIHYLKESGLSIEEQNIVLDKPTQNQSASTSTLVYLLIAINFLLLCVCFYFYITLKNSKVKYEIIKGSKSEFTLPE